MSVEVYGKDGCMWCEKAIQLLEAKCMNYSYYKLGKDITLNEFKEMFPDAKTVPVILIHGFRIGGYNDLVGYIEETAGGFGESF